MKALIAATAALASLVAPGPAGSAPVPTDPPARPAPATRADLPAPGEGWYLAAVEQGRPGREGLRGERLRLELVAPDGDRTRVGRALRPGWRLVDWSADGSTALLTVDQPHRVVLRVDVTTGDVTRSRLPDRVAEVILAPDGDGLLTVDYEGRDTRAPLKRVSADGAVTRLTPDVDGPVLPTPDGTGLVTHGPSWRQRAIRLLSSADGSVQTVIPTPRRCTPVRWWDDHRVLVTCLAHGATTLGLVDMHAATYTRLTARRHPQRSDLGHLDARRADGRLYVQVAGPCGYAYLGRRHPNGRITHVEVPHAVGNVLLVDAHDGRLTLQHAINCDGAAPRSALASFDPSTGKERRLVVLPRDRAFAAVLPYGERRPTGY
ncbi:hypothetical protein [Nocardioides sp. YIM 152315]|uniref:hypothetical protein n=1 Tax=Nocardioides sp. YIM 152315 TaxID=3031760 RepID=UPI0023DB809E|nr:hypothetical protein [Nocardioides sp. YIM 152315]MDF1606472.1 hypothetical protein [Nocardioides sp. YIM 152315]